MAASKKRNTTAAASSAGRTASQNSQQSQSTLSFRTSKSSARVTKPSGKPASPSSKKQHQQEQQQQQQQQKKSAAVAAAAEAEPARPPTPPTATERAALALPASKLKAYWRGKETARLAPRVHQADLPLEEKILREFDMSSRFGPSVGLSRRERWDRASGLGLAPPVEVLAVLLQGEGVEGAGITDRLVGGISERAA